MTYKKWNLEVTDSFHDIVLPHHSVAVTYSPEWQGLRLSVSFKSYESVRRTIGIGHAYIDAATTDNEHKCRLIRVRKLLNAIKTYSDEVDVPTAEIIWKHVDILTAILDGKDRDLIWDWHIARKQAFTMYQNVIGLFELMYTDLQIRSRRQGKKTELRYFLTILDEVISESTS